MCRALEAFLLAQMPSNSLLRLEAKAPGYVREPKRVCTRKILLFLLSLSAVKVDHYISDERGWLRNYPLLDKTRTDGRNDCLLSRPLAQLFVCLTDLLVCLSVCLSAVCVFICLCPSICLSVCLFFVSHFDLLCSLHFRLNSKLLVGVSFPPLLKLNKL